MTSELENIENKVESMEIDAEKGATSAAESALPYEKLKTEATLKDEMLKHPICVIVLGMAGAGKTSFITGLSKHMHSASMSHRVINLDPAVKQVPFVPYIDIRDTIKYKEIMKEYGLGPNGSIVTSLNLFTTMTEDVINLIKKKKDELEFLLFDTPGQIEVFNWSASGPIIVGSLASIFPTVIVYVYDSVQSTNTQSFMSNMLYACSILYKYKLPLIIAMNKIDVVSCQYAVDWMADFQKFNDAADEDDSYSASLSKSLSLVIDEFYQNIKTCGVSAHEGTGMEEFTTKLYELAEEYEKYREEQIKNLASKDDKKNESKEIKEEKEEEGLITVRKQINDADHMYLHPSSDNSEEEEEELDEEDTEENKERESFNDFIARHKANRATPHD